ncbi:MAG: amidohydrolase family protein [Gemmatimonadaceae bacterium]
MTVITDGTRISAVGPSSELGVPGGASVTDGTGMYLIPGLWDMHVHSSTEGEAALAEYVAHGVTGVRDMGSEVHALSRLRDAVRRGDRLGPRILMAGPMIESVDAMRGILERASAADSARAVGDRLVVRSPAAAASGVDSLARLGVDMIKARDFTDAATYWAIARAARAAHLPFVGHAPFGLPVAAEAVADSGQRTLEHWYFPTDLFSRPREEYERAVAAYARNRTAFAPTFQAWRQHRFTVDSLDALLAIAAADPRATQLPLLVSHWRRELAGRLKEIDGKPATADQLKGWNSVLDKFGRETAQLAAAGIPTIAGSDLPFARFPGDALHDEPVRFVVEAGYTPRRALATATTFAVEAAGVSDSLGAIRPGLLADMVLLGGNPGTDIEQVRRVNAVMQSGRFTWKKR